jgi:hypothetical protein
MIIERDAVYRIGDVAELLSVSESTIRNFIRDGLPHRKIRSIIFIKGDELLGFMSADQSKAVNPKLVKFKASHGIA